MAHILTLLLVLGFNFSLLDHESGEGSRDQTECYDDSRASAETVGGLGLGDWGVGSWEGGEATCVEGSSGRLSVGKIGRGLR